MKKKIALIFGVTGQDGSYLSRLLLSKNYIVHGVKRRSSSLNTNRIDDIYEDIHEAKNFFLHYGDVNDGQSIYNIIKKVKPDEIYNLAAQSHVAVSFEIPEYTLLTNGIGTLKILECIRNLNNKIKTYDNLGDRIKRSLGYPLISLEIHTDQLRQNIQIAFEYFNKINLFNRACCCTNFRS